MTAVFTHMHKTWAHLWMKRDRVGRWGVVKVGIVTVQSHFSNAVALKISHQRCCLQENLDLDLYIAYCSERQHTLLKKGGECMNSNVCNLTSRRSSWSKQHLCNFKIKMLCVPLWHTVSFRQNYHKVFSSYKSFEKFMEIILTKNFKLIIILNKGIKLLL